ncbi:alanine dehydrogenase [Azohydromonas australica]|uniref:alanine dehydrogenase n=1 Tax=Azohydromonas australica TaxID=364039 RepID=UPI00041223FF|nr:alanine dehydrogenase [Azohydromonas australica]
MLIGVPKEIKDHEYRVGLTPSSVRELVAAGHQVLVEHDAGAGIGAGDAAYGQAGARIGTAEEVFASAEMIVKVKEPLAPERARLQPGQVLFTYLHLAADPQQCQELLASGAICIAYETVTAPGGGLPLLAPMSEVAGRMSVQAAARSLERAQGGRGMLLGGVPGVAAARLVVLGAGVVGSNAALMAVGSGAQVVVIDRSLEALRRIEQRFGARVLTVFSNRDNVEAHVRSADVVIGAVLVPGAAAPRLVSRELLAGMQPGSVVVDVAIDQGGCFETSRPTTHTDPTYVVEGVVHYCVTNMPGAVPLTSAHALNHATLPYVMALADKGWQRALREDVHLLHGLNVAAGKLTCRQVASSLGMPFHPPQGLLED